jgi:hypothetical protein
MALSKANAVLLATIVASMANEATPYHMVTEAEAAKLVKEGLVETNGEIRDGDKIAARATEKGIQVNTSDNASGAPAAVTSNFAIDDGIAIPPSRGGRNRSVYPFDQLTVGQSFHVPASEAKPNPAKSLASTVSSANKRNAKEGASGFKFEVRSVDATDTRGAGARVWRIA